MDEFSLEVEVQGTYKVRFGLGVLLERNELSLDLEHSLVLKLSILKLLKVRFKTYVYSTIFNV